MTPYDIRRGLHADDLLQFRWIDELTLDPTGQRVAYTMRRPDAPSNGYMVDLFVMTLADASTRCLTDGTGKASALAWDTEGEQLAYSWSGADGNQLRIWSPDGAERSLAVDGASLAGLDWSPDGRRLAGVRWTPYRDAHRPATRSGIPAPNVRVIRRLRYKQDGVGFVHDRYTQIWTVDTVAGTWSQITTAECDCSEPRWNRKGDMLAFTAMAREQNTELGQSQIMLHDLATSQTRPLLPEWVGSSRSPAWSPDDRAIAFAGHTHPAPTNRRIFSRPFLADVAAGTARELAPELDQEVGNYAIADQRKGLSNITIRWAADDPWFWFLLTEQGATHLYRMNAEGAYERVVDGPCVVFEYSPAAGAVAYGRADPTNPGDLYLRRGDTTTRLTTLNPWLGDHALVEPQEYWYDGIDGTPVHAWVMTPPDLDTTRSYPLVLQVHCSMFSWDFCHEFQCLAAAGYVVAYFNQRGTTAGYGQTWTRASEGDQGGQDYQEIMLGLDDLLRRHPFIDPARMGVTGGSCGGLMTNWIVGHTDRFAAAVTQRSITNNISFTGTSDIGPECNMWETRSDAWSDLQKNWQQSPIAYAEAIRTPLLIIHADEDHRCPLEQAEQLFAVLRWLGRTVELVVFEGEDHGLSRGGRIGNRIERLDRITGWFDHYLAPALSAPRKEDA